ncbi:probable E3 ubiquitin ligase complex SCF subunit sconB [Patiria miniata]|uniref:F-box domain-containing protein n=1 Tax=Patiria miniata TaxID=46514 RepID=A0A914A9P9_PATMI|nr:probable E3 ubiquitin ligase complex SCF subunit sconB [Patiria miniata]
MNCCGWICGLKRDTSKAEVNLTDLSQELNARIFRHLTATDLCHVALCNRILRDTANDDALWRPLCQKKGWERYGTICDLCKEPPFKPSSQDQKTGEGGAPTFPDDVLVTSSDWPGLVDTCKWKEVYMKARHLEENWRNQRFFAANLLSTGLSSVAYEGDCLAAGASYSSTLEIWDMAREKRQHLIQLDISGYPGALQMEDGIIAAGCKDGKIRTYSAQTGEQLQVMSGHRLAVSRLFFDGDTIVSVGQYDIESDDTSRSDIRVWSAVDGVSRCILKSGLEATNLVHIDYKDKIVAGAYSDNKIRIWDARNDGSCMQQIVCEMENLISCHLWNGIVIGASKGRIVKQWELKSGECIKTFDVPLFRGLIQPSQEQSYYVFSDELLAVVTLFSGLPIVNLNGERLLTVDLSDVIPVCFKGRKLLTWSMGAYKLWIIDPVERLDGTAQINSRTASQFLGPTHFPCAWMSDIKIIFALQMRDSIVDMSSIWVRHYW